jgi:hypothetical protein
MSFLGEEEFSRLNSCISHIVALINNHYTTDILDQYRQMLMRNSESGFKIVHVRQFQNRKKIEWTFWM